MRASAQDCRHPSYNQLGPGAQTLIEPGLGRAHSPLRGVRGFNSHGVLPVESGVPRDLPVGNGNLLVAFDRTYRLSELYYPHVGMANHLLGRPFRFGLWSEGVFSWTHDDAWVRTLRYEPDTLVTDVKLVNQAFGLELTCHDCVDFDYDL